jgi:putative membrane protein (TIGR04086 family)
MDDRAVDSPGPRWGRAILAGILGEVILLLLAAPIYAFSADAEPLLNIVVPPASFIAFVAAGWWSARPLPGNAVLQGTLAGVAAVALYLLLGAVASALSPAAELTDAFTPAYLLAHALKVAGGAVGGLLVARHAA